MYSFIDTLQNCKYVMLHCFIRVMHPFNSQNLSQICAATSSQILQQETTYKSLGAALLGVDVLNNNMPPCCIAALT